MRVSDQAVDGPDDVSRRAGSRPAGPAAVTYAPRDPLRRGDRPAGRVPGRAEGRRPTGGGSGQAEANAQAGPRPGLVRQHTVAVQYDDGPKVDAFDAGRGAVQGI